MYALLCNYASETDHCWPSQATLAARLSCSVNSVKKYLAELAGEKLIAVRREQYRASVYYLLFPSELENREPKAARQEPKIDDTLSKVGYLNNLNKQEEKENPPLPPAQPEPVKSPPASGQRFVGGGDSFFHDFEKAWDAYPKKEAQGLAHSSWLQLRKNGQLPPLEKILASIRHFCASASWQREQGRFIPQMANFLRGQRWLDPLSPEETQAEQRRQEMEQMALACQREEEAHKAQQREKWERKKPIFEAFAAKFQTESESDSRQAMISGTWSFLYEKFGGPTAADVPEGNSLEIWEFLKAYERKCGQGAYLSAHPPVARGLNISGLEEKREGRITSCADVLKRMFPARESLCAAV